MKALSATITARNARNLAGLLASLPLPTNLAALGRNAASLRRDEPWTGHVDGNEAAIRRHAEAAIAWIARSQDRVGSGGVGDFRFQGWTPGYPEVTGYIIPTFFDYQRLFSRQELGERAVRMAEWELGIQKPGGGFESWYEGEGRPPVVFNTGQVIRGLLRTALETGDERFLEGALRAARWIASAQKDDGSFAVGNYLGMTVVYDVYATAGLALLARKTGDEQLAAAARANAEFALSHQLDNGWFDSCANTPHGHEHPITHTLCYTADGLIEIGLALDEPKFVRAGELTARAMLERMQPGGWLPGRFDRNWNPTASHVVLTGSSQLGIILSGMHARSPEPRLHEASRALFDFAAYVQDLNASAGPNRRGALPGSYPVWGRYVPLKYPSWAAKFFLDHARMLLTAADAGPRDRAARPAARHHPL